MPKVKESKRFKKIKSKLDNSQLIKVRKLIGKIINNPEIGKPMRNVRKGTRELYIKPFRLSYSYDKNEETVFILDLYHKDRQ